MRKEGTLLANRLPKLAPFAYYGLQLDGLLEVLDELVSATPSHQAGWFMEARVAGLRSRVEALPTGLRAFMIQTRFVIRSLRESEHLTCTSHRRP